MRSLISSLIVLAVFSSFAFAQSCGHACTAADKKAGGCCATEAKMASYTDARQLPSCAPEPVHDFHRVLMPFIEARTNAEPSYVRDNVKFLVDAAKPVPTSKACCNSFNKKAFKTSAKDLVKDCEQLQKLSLDKAVKDDAVMAQLKIVEDDYVTLVNTCQ